MKSTTENYGKRNFEKKKRKYVREKFPEESKLQEELENCGKHENCEIRKIAKKKGKITKNAKKW